MSASPSKSGGNLQYCLMIVLLIIIAAVIICRDGFFSAGGNVPLRFVGGEVAVVPVCVGRGWWVWFSKKFGGGGGKERSED